VEGTIQFLIHQGYVVLCVWVVLEHGGLPIPAVPVMLAALGTAEQDAREPHR
jgi:hypothetical protein